MKVYSQTYSRLEYIETQIKRSKRKFSYCKVSIRDPLRYIQNIRAYCASQKISFPLGPVVCLGTRNGREVDLFRTALYSPWLSELLTLSELKRKGFMSPLDILSNLGRSDVQHLSDSSVIGVEINPDAARQDVWVGSFDEMPAEWSNQFSIVYSNSFDQAQDPHRTAKEWLRITKPGGFLIIAFGVHKQPSATDPVGDLVLADVLSLFPGELVYYTAQGTLYAEAIIRKPE